MSSNSSDRPAQWRRAAKVIIVSSVMFSFISYWRTAAVVLCDMSSTAYYIGGIVEQAIGPAAPWFILAVLLFSSAVRLVYVESCSLFVRGGVYRVVKTAMGGFMGKLAVSALMFDYILTGPISSVSAGQYIMSLGLDSLSYLSSNLAIMQPGVKDAIRNWGAVLIAMGIIWYFYRQNVLGIHESSEKALKIMIATTIMAVIIIGWSLATLAVEGPRNKVPLEPNLEKKVVAGVAQPPLPKLNPVTGEQEDPLGFLGYILPESLNERLRHPHGWLSAIGIFGLLLAFGHSILAMSGEETLAQVYREVESPKLPNFKRAALIVFLYSLLFTGSISFLAVLLIPDDVRMQLYSENLIGGLAHYVLGPPWLHLLLNALVVVVGFMILSGAANTAIIGSNGVLSRVAEDGVLTSWFLRPHPLYGTNYRLLRLIVALQLFTILVSRGNMYLLGEAYAFGVVWSFVFQSLSMLILRFTDRRPREFKVPVNVRLGRFEVPVGLGLIFVILLGTALVNFFTKEVATVAGVVFTTGFMTVFTLSERYYEKRRRGGRHEHLEQFNKETSAEVSPASLELTRPYRKLVAIRSPQNLFMLEKALAETDPLTTEVVVMTAKMMPREGGTEYSQDLDPYDQQLMTAVVNVAEKAGKEVKPLIVPTNNPLHAVLNTAKDLEAQELIMGASNKYTADEQMDMNAFYWINLHGGNPAPLTVRILSRERDMYQDLGGGNRIPKISERQARTVAELRAAGVGVDRVLLVHDGSPASRDLFQAVLTMLDPQVVLALLPMIPSGDGRLDGSSVLHQDEEKAVQLGRAMEVIGVKAGDGAEVVQLARERQFDLIILPLSGDLPSSPFAQLDSRFRHILAHAHCRVLLAVPPAIPPEVVDTTPSP